MAQQPLAENTIVREQTALLHPWRRYFARGLDFSLYDLIWMAFEYFVLRWQPENNILITLLISYIGYGMMLLIEPVLLATWGTTPGKWIMGLVVRTPDGKKLAVWQARERALGVFMYGMGYGIPIYNIVRMLKCRSASLRNETMSWDEGIDYQLLDTKRTRLIGYALAWAAGLALAILIAFQAQMPLHRGDITPEQYAANVNEVLNRGGNAQGKHLLPDGTWENNPFNGVVYVDMGTPMHTLTIEDGIVTGVRIEVTNRTNNVQYNYGYQKQLLYLAFLAAQKEANCIRILAGPELKRVTQTMGDYSFTLAGVRVTNEVEYSGYSDAGTMLFPVVEEEQYFHMKFTMERADG